jgi:pimeloyl-ACP methyl ester carboxylesterase
MLQHDGVAHSASRVDPDGFEEHAAFIGDDERLFSYRHIPREKPRAAVLICPSICADFIANYRREVRLARVLVARNLAVQRFHYRGTGNSDGDPEAITFESLRDDALRALEGLLRETRVSSVVLVGTRWGALVAAAVSQTFPAAPLVFWEPTIDAADYFREARRARLMRDAKEGRTPEASFADLEEEMAALGVLDLLGYPVYGPLYETAKEQSLPSLLDHRGHSVLIVSMAERERVQRRYEGLDARLSAAGHDVTLLHAASSGSWWFHGDDVRPLGGVVRATVNWVGEHAGSQVTT